ncbi:MAG: hypothetical protein Q8K63_16035, partial [Acidimicrobiales bacterium]|nr:hypothetical protein [Acidimicrobiales bacterium]
LRLLMLIGPRWSHCAARCASPNFLFSCNVRPLPLDVFLERCPWNAPRTTDTDRRDLAALNEAVESCPTNREHSCGVNDSKQKRPGRGLLVRVHANTKPFICSVTDNNGANAPSENPEELPIAPLSFPAKSECLGVADYTL